MNAKLLPMTNYYWVIAHTCVCLMLVKKLIQPPHSIGCFARTMDNWINEPLFIVRQLPLYICGRSKSYGVHIFNHNAIKVMAELCMNDKMDQVVTRSYLDQYSLDMLMQNQTFHSFLHQS